jgi:SRSO17 transposase
LPMLRREELASWTGRCTSRARMDQRLEPEGRGRRSGGADTFANKVELAKRMLQRAFAAGIPARWVVADSFYGPAHTSSASGWRSAVAPTR